MIGQDDRCVAGRKLEVSTKMIVAGACAAFVMIILSTYHNRQIYTLIFGFAPLLAVITIPQILSDLGYRVSWDGARIYMRPHGVRWILGLSPETSIRYDAISSVRGEMGPFRKFQSRFMPFDHVQIYGDTDGPAPSIMISPNFMRLADARAVLREIHDRRPEVFSNEVVDFINQGAE